MAEQILAKRKKKEIINMLGISKIKEVKKKNYTQLKSKWLESSISKKKVWLKGLFYSGQIDELQSSL